jgi:lipoprotein-anchoring transpeptidase ErfK/SrfK
VRFIRSRSTTAAGFVTVLAIAVGGFAPPHADASTAPVTIEIRLASRQLVVERDGKTIRLMKVAVGKPSTPTPLGPTKVLEVRPTQDPRFRGPVGPFNLRLDAKSAVIPDYAIDGWPGIVIQGTNCPKTCLGTAATSGSIRVSNTNITWLAENIPVGTTVDIV